MKGYLEKTGEGFGSLVWKKRYCELSNNYLIYYQNGVFKGQIPLQNATISWIGNKVFQLKLPYRTYSFKGSSIAGNFIFQTLFLNSILYKLRM